MKRLLLTVLVCLLLAAPVSALSLTFQDSSEFGAYVTCTGTAGGSCTWTQSATGGNNYIRVTGSPTPFSGGYYYLRNLDSSTTTYAAATSTYIGGGGNPRIELYNSALGSLYAYGGTGPGTQRWEMKMVGGRADIYVDGKFVARSGVLAQNPSYIGWGTTTTNHYGECIWDDFVYGTTENREIVGSPEQGYYLKKDLTNPAANGFYDSADNLISSYNMTTTWGVGDTNTSRTIILKEWASGDTVWTYTTTAGTMAGSIAWPLQEAIFNNPNADYGYYITTISGSGEYSTVIPYVAYGATVTFNQDSYSRGDTATITWNVMSGGYWDTGTYGYRLDVMDVYGNVVSTTPVTTQAGSITATFADDDSLGVYYAVLIATPLAGGDDIWMNYDYCDLTGYLVFTGYVNNAENATPIAAHINITQSTGISYSTSTPDGNYTTNTAFYSSSLTVFNVTSTGYWPYHFAITPIAAKTISLNFTLASLTPSFTGIALGGITNDTVYGRPVADATVTVVNATHAESYSVQTNNAGYYLLDESDGVFLTIDRCYHVTATKSGYSASTYLKCVRASI